MFTATRRIPTTDMQVTSIRLETDLKERLKTIAGEQGYQALIRDILWDHVERSERSESKGLALSEIKATIAAVAHRDEICAVTGQRIVVGQSMWLGWTMAGQLVPLAQESFA
jgi:predicted transcriptional regulator